MCKMYIIPTYTIYTYTLERAQYPMQCQELQSHLTLGIEHMCEHDNIFC